MNLPHGYDPDAAHTKDRLEKWCCASFPYVCMGEKVIDPRGCVECDCGAWLKIEPASETPHE